MKIKLESKDKHILELGKLYDKDDDEILNEEHDDYGNIGGLGVPILTFGMAKITAIYDRHYDSGTALYYNLA